MLEIEVCIGSACHIKGSYQVIEMMKERIQSEGMDSKIRLKSSFCLGKCGEGVSVRVDGDIISLTPETTEEWLTQRLAAMS